MAVAEVHLPEELVEAGAALLRTTDDLVMHAQGAMWLRDHALGDWRYYLVTSLVDVIGRRKTYRLLIDAFEKVALPKSMTVDDVHLGSPSDGLFLFVSRLPQVDGGLVRFDNTTVEFEGTDIRIILDALIYRAVKAPPSASEAGRIEKRFSKRVKDLVSA